jgi:hypothetical protein
MPCCSSPPADKPADSAKPAVATNKGLDGIDRKCKDVLFLLLFIVAWAGKLSAASLCWHVAQPRIVDTAPITQVLFGSPSEDSRRGTQTYCSKASVACAVLFELGPAHCAFRAGYDFLGRVCGEGVMP